MINYYLKEGAYNKEYGGIDEVNKRMWVLN